MVVLYVLDGCPFCIRVEDFAKENEIPYDRREISDSDHRAKLIELGGKTQVPYLVDEENNVGMYESSDIIEYLSSKN